LALEDGDEVVKKFEEVLFKFCCCERGNPFKQRSVVKATRTPFELFYKN
jgi:hypothetical protein